MIEIHQVNGERAARVLRALKHPKSRQAGGAFELAPWQERIVPRIYRPCDDNGRRLVRTVFTLPPRGNRKTVLGRIDTQDSQER